MRSLVPASLVVAVLVGAWIWSRRRPKDLLVEERGAQLRLSGDWQRDTSPGFLVYHSSDGHEHVVFHFATPESAPMPEWAIESTMQKLIDANSNAAKIAGQTPATQ